MAVMVHSRAFHAGSLEWDHTVERDTDLSAARVVVLGVTPTAIGSRPRQVLSGIEAAYLGAQGVGYRPDVTATRRPDGLLRGARQGTTPTALPDRPRLRPTCFSRRLSRRGRCRQDSDPRDLTSDTPCRGSLEPSAPRWRRSSGAGSAVGSA